jgi:Cu(I)/Ag(I) efflux system membrane fusion protein
MRKLLYYRNPMGLPDTSPVPKKDWMGMDYIPVYEGEDEAGTSVTISHDRVQRSGVRTEKAQMRQIERHVRAPGIAKPDERSLRIVSLRADGFIEKLYANETGQHVKAGDPLFRVYSPQVVSAQVDFRTTSSYGRGERDEQSAIQRLKNLDVPEAVIEQLRKGGRPILVFDWPAPVSGYVMEKNVVEGQMAKAGDPLFRIAGLDPVWVICDVPEQDIAIVREGAMAKVGFRAFPDRLFQGRVTFVLHELDAKTRTAKVRVEIPNPDHIIRHEMFADVEIAGEGSDRRRLVVPSSAVIDTGSRQVILVDRGEGRFEPRNVVLGIRGDETVEVIQGLAEGESVVVSANFLIDAESSIRSALKAFTADSVAPAEGASASPTRAPSTPASREDHDSHQRARR